MGLPAKYLEESPRREFVPLATDTEEESPLDRGATSREEGGQAERQRLRREQMRLDVGGLEDAAAAAASSGGQIVFSPGGSEAYVFPRVAAEAAAEASDPEVEATESPHKVGGGAVPRTLPAIGSSKRKTSSSSDKRQRPYGRIQERLEDYRSSLAQEASSAAEESVEPSPRLHPSEARRLLPRLPVSRELYQHDPDGAIGLSETEVASTTDASESGPGGGMASPVVVPSLPLSDRAHSPASVVSAASSTASGMLSGRKHLEWDSGADLGYLGGPPPELEAASLSTLEKMAIGSYSDLLQRQRAEPEGRSTKTSRGSTRVSSATHQRSEDEMRQMRLHKFADSLMRQRELRKMAAADGARRQGGDSPHRDNRRRQRSRSRESARAGGRKTASDSAGGGTPEASPGRYRKNHEHRRGSSSHPQGRKHSHRRRQFGSPLKSTSLTDLYSSEPVPASAAAFAKTRSHSNQDVSSPWFLKSAFAVGSTEPSSSNSSVTVVPILRGGGDVKGEEEALMDRISTDPSSLPVHLQSMLLMQLQEETGEEGVGRGRGEVGSGGGNPEKSSRASQGSLLSKRSSGSRSFETVINLGARPTSDSRRHRRSGSGGGGGRRRYAAREKLNNSDNSLVDDTDEEEEAREKGASAYFSRREAKSKEAWPVVDNEAEEEEGSGGQEEGRRRNRHSQVSRTSSGVTTSDDEKRGGRRRRRRRAADGGEQAAATATSTMESLAQIDRAKSFEYFPGESFPMQENSSSYEYLPGHLVSDRPGTVVSNYRTDDIGGRGERVSGVASMSESTSSEVGGRGRRNKHHRRSSSTNNNSNGARRKIELHQGGGGLLDEELLNVGDELNGRSRELLDAHLSKTRKFYRRVKRYVTYLAEPASESASPEEREKREEVMQKLFRMLERQEESVGVESDDSVRASEVTTRQIQTEDAIDAGGRRREDNTDVSTASSGISKNDGSKTNKSAAERNNSDSSEITLQKRRIEQLRAVRKEMKKLEALESAHLARKLKGQQVKDYPSDLSSVAYSSFERKKDGGEAKKQPLPSKVSAPAAEPKKTQVQKASGHPRNKAPPSSSTAADAKKQKSKTSSETYIRRTTTSGTVTKSKTHLLVTGGEAVFKVPNRAPPGSRASRPSSSSSTTTAASSSLRGHRQQQHGRRGTNVPDLAEFGQTYPTPRDAAEEGPSTKNKVSKGIQTNGEQQQVRKRTPVAYYLPMGGQSVIRIGSRNLRSRGADTEEASIGKENRNLLANYIAGLDAESIRLEESWERNGGGGKSNKEDDDKDNENPRRKLTLRDALSARRPNFVAEAERRRRHLLAMRERRLLNEAARRRWAEELARMSPRARRRARAALSPPPVARVTRLFGHREMVEATRRRYHRLPEVSGARAEARRRTSASANRIVRDVFGRRLQENVLRGRVSLTHHCPVIYH